MNECARLSCNKPAVALLTFSPSEAKAWLYDLDQPDPTGGIMLCRRHANATVVPMSWQLVDARDPAWPGPATEPPTASAPVNPPAIHTAAGDRRGLPSDQAALDEEFAALRSDLPITPQRYAEPQLAIAHAVGRRERDLLIDLSRGGGPDPSLFELPISDIPAVTPHPGY